jgi:hypothetical protein
MTGGVVVILGPTGFNLGAGMTGGECYVLDETSEILARVNGQLVEARRPDGPQLDHLRDLVELHTELTGLRDRAPHPRRLGPPVAGVLARRPRTELARVETAQEGSVGARRRPPVEGNGSYPGWRCPGPETEHRPTTERGLPPCPMSPCTGAPCAATASSSSASCPAEASTTRPSTSGRTAPQAEIVKSATGGDEIVPTVQVGQQFLVNPSADEVQAALTAA